MVYQTNNSLYPFNTSKYSMFKTGPKKKLPLTQLWTPLFKIGIHWNTWMKVVGFAKTNIDWTRLIVIVDKPQSSYFEHPVHNWSEL
jgi:hypothetical protein